MTLRQARKFLKKHGYSFDRHGSNHEIWAKHGHEIPLSMSGSKQVHVARLRSQVRHPTYRKDGRAVGGG